MVALVSLNELDLYAPWVQNDTKVRDFVISELLRQILVCSVWTKAGVSYL